MPDAVELTFWGVRGGIPTPVVENLGFRGNTPCLSIRHGDAPLLLLDAGSGLRALGNSLSVPANGRMHVNMLFTHFHRDHIQGIPDFAPVFRSDCRIIFHSIEPVDRLRGILLDQMRSPYFPVEMPAVQANYGYAQVESAGLELDGLRIQPFRLRHPDGAHGYRVDSSYGTIVYATDHEHGDERIDDGLRSFARDADILITMPSAHQKSTRAGAAGVTALGWKARAWRAMRGSNGWYCFITTHSTTMPRWTRLSERLRPSFRQRLQRGRAAR